ncbi:hypothetical protein PFISCL1PPCAC_3785, partial [Pristionchus fissidentatus]
TFFQLLLNEIPWDGVRLDDLDGNCGVLSCFSQHRRATRMLRFNNKNIANLSPEDEPQTLVSAMLLYL